MRWPCVTSDGGHGAASRAARHGWGRGTRMQVGRAEFSRCVRGLPLQRLRTRAGRVQQCDC